MKLKWLWTLNTFTGLFFGLGMVLFPAQILSLYGITPDHSHLVTGQMGGAAWLTFGVLAFSVRNAGRTAVLQAIIQAFFIGNIVGFAVSLLGQIGGVANALGWTNVGLYLFYALAYGYFLFVKTD